VAGSGQSQSDAGLLQVNIHAGTRRTMASPTATPMEYLVEPEFLVPLPPDDLMFDDGEPWESNRHRIAINVLIRSAQQALASRADVFIGGNMFVYFSREQAIKRDVRGPDVLMVLGVPPRQRQGWVVWEEGGRYPDLTYPPA
jgi:hypothetical protein